MPWHAEWGNPPIPIILFVCKHGESNWEEGIMKLNKIGFVKRTRGTETSQYLEEKTSTEIPLVVASERGPGQCLKFN